jgi:gas vesicle protein
VKKKTCSLSAGFFVGTLVGGTIALLLAPQSGADTRATIRQKNSELKDKVARICTQVLKKFETVTRRALSKTEELLARLQGAYTWDEDELARWDEELAEIEQASQEALEEARMG